MSSSNGDRWSKFWWLDWQNDPALRLCSLAAQGLWMRMLCLCHEATPVGHLLINGRQPTHRQLASLVGASEREVGKLLVELAAAGVFSTTADGTIYSRRMVRDKVALDFYREKGREGGNPSLNGKDPLPKKPEGGLTPPLTPPLSPRVKPPDKPPVNPPLNPPLKPPLKPGVILLESEQESQKEQEEEKKESKFKILTSVSPVLARVAAACETPPPGTIGADPEDEPVPRAAQAEVRNLHQKVVRKLAAIARPATKYAEHSVAEQIAECAAPPPPLAIPRGLEAAVRASRRALAEHARVVLANSFPP